MGRKRINMKGLLTKLSLVGLLVAFTQCASGQKVENTMPVKITEAYFQKWVSGIREGGTGFTIYLSLEEPSDIVLENAYFKGKKIKLHAKPDQTVYIGKYTNKSRKADLIMSNDPKKEFKNTVPEIEEKIPFQMEEGSCILEYTKKGKKEHITIDNLTEKELLTPPMQRRQ